MAAYDNFRLDGKVALVTGSGRGIGAAIAIELGKRGAQVVVNYSRAAEAANKVVEAIQANGSEAIAIKADVGEIEQVTGLMEQAIERFGQLDIVSSNAGVVSFGHLKDVSGDVRDSTMPGDGMAKADRGDRSLTGSFGSTREGNSLWLERPTSTLASVAESS